MNNDVYHNLERNGFGVDENENVQRAATLSMHDGDAMEITSNVHPLHLPSSQSTQAQDDVVTPDNYELQTQMPVYDVESQPAKQLRATVGSYEDFEVENDKPDDSAFAHKLENEESYSSDEDDKDEWVEYEFTVDRVSEHLNRGTKLTSPVFYSTNGYPWRLGIYFMGHGKSAQGRDVSVFVELGDVDGKKYDVALPTRRNADFFLDIKTRFTSPRLLSELKSQCEKEKKVQIEGRVFDYSEHFTLIRSFGAKIIDWFDVSTRADVGFNDFCSRRLLTYACIDDNDCCTFICRIRATDFGNGDSRTNTGMVGLLNQGATCYLNSLLQTLYHTRFLRRAVYALDTSSDKAEQGVALELQHLFADLQTKPTAVSTQTLTKAFGWTDNQVFTQHDVQELLRELLDKLNERMKGTDKESVIKDLFCGQFATYIRCINVPMERSREEEFFDLQLDVRGSRSVLESFRKYVQEERLDGDNQYDAEGYGKQDAMKGVKFLKFPPVLHLHLKRFAYDYEQDRTFKIHDRFEFPQMLDLAEFMPLDQKQSSMYRLHSVLVHSGNDQRGHYYAFVYLDDGHSKGKWYKFNDEVVTRVKKRTAIQSTFGTGAVHSANNDTSTSSKAATSNGSGHYTGTGMYATAAANWHANKRFRSSSFQYDEVSIDSNASAYMLVYVCENEWKEIMAPVDRVPLELLERFERDLKAKQLEKETAEKNKYRGTIRVATLEDVLKFNKFRPTKKQENDDWVEWDATRVVDYGDVRDALVSTLYKAVARDFPHLKPGRFRLWSTCPRENDSIRLDEILEDKPIKIKEADFNRKVYLEELDVDVSELPEIERDDVCLLFREYDPALPGIVPGAGRMLFPTGLKLNVSPISALWDCLAIKVLGKDVTEVKQQYELYEFVTASLNDKNNVKSIIYTETGLITGNHSAGNHEFEAVGDIVIYAKKVEGKPCRAYFSDLLRTITFQCRPLYPHVHRSSPNGITMNGGEVKQPRDQFSVTVHEESIVDQDLIEGIAKEIRCDPAYIQLTNGEYKPENKPLELEEYSSSCLNVFIPRSGKGTKRNPMMQPIVFYEVIPILRSDTDEKTCLRVLVLTPVRDHVKSNGKSANSCAAMRWDDCRVEIVVVQKETTSCRVLFEELERLLHLDSGLELVVYLVRNAGRVERFLQVNSLFDDTLSKCTSHGLILIGEDGRPTVPAELGRDPERLVAEVIPRPPPTAGKIFKLAVSHCTLRDETAHPQELGLPSVAYVMEHDSLGDLWKRVMSRLNIPSEMSAQWRPVLGTRTIGQKMVFLDVRANSSDSDSVNGDSDATLVAGPEISVASALTNSIRSKRPKVPQDEYDSMPLWTRREIQEFVGSAVLEISEEEEEERDLQIARSLVFYIRHPNGSSVPQRTSTPMHSLTIRSS